MAESPMFCARVPSEWQEKIRGIAEADGRREAEVVHEAIGQYLAEVDASAVKGAIADLQERLAKVKALLAGFRRSVG